MAGWLADDGHRIGRVGWFGWEEIKSWRAQVNGIELGQTFAFLYEREGGRSGKLPNQLRFLMDLLIS